MILSSFLKALGQLGDGRFQRVFWLGVASSIAILFALTWGLSTAVGWLIGDTVWIPLIGEITWADTVVSWGAMLTMLLLSVFLMVPVASLVISLFLDTVADAVEQKHYPNLPPPDGVSFVETIRDTLSFLGLVIVANTFALLLYFTPLAPFVFWGLNGFLLGREYFTLAAIRRVGREGARKLRRQYFLTIWTAGVLMAVPLTIPIVNLIVPILGAATFTHLYHKVGR